ncbi:MAG: YnbE family lipoprotein [Chlorobi bacterium]|nr:YnbE family lipoprotein [Chlorobiota bacterium]
MKRLVILSLITLLGLTGCNAQSAPKDNNGEINDTVKVQPDINIKVNKEYDENGNLIRYDSTYTYVYSNIDGNIQLQDSIFNEFMKHFNDHFGISADPFFNDLFFTDSLLQYDFYKKDFFHDRFMQNSKWIEEMLREMDSIKNEFYKNRFKYGGQQPKKL